MNYVGVVGGAVVEMSAGYDAGYYKTDVSSLVLCEYRVAVHNPNLNQPTGEKREVYDPESGIATFEDVLDEREVLLLERPKTEEEIENLRKAKVVSLIREKYSINDEFKLLNLDREDEEYKTYRQDVVKAKASASAWALEELDRARELQAELDKYTIVTGPKEEEDEEKVLDKQEVL
jgi:hypothetical protein